MKKEIFNVCQILGSSYFVKIEKFCESPEKTYSIDIRDYGIDEFLKNAKDERLQNMHNYFAKRGFVAELRCCYKQEYILSNFGYSLLSNKIFKFKKRRKNGYTMP